MPTGLSAQAVAELVGGRLRGTGDTVLTELASLERAGPHSLAFLLSERYLPAFRRSAAGAVLLGSQFEAEPEGPPIRIVVDDPGRSLVLLAQTFAPSAAVHPGIDPSARIGSGVRLGAGVSIAPHVVLEAGASVGRGCRLDAGVWVGPGVSIGEDCHLGPHAVCYPGSTLGNRVVLKAGAVIGGVGFGFLPSDSGHGRIPHLGRCILEDDVEVGSHSCVDRGSFEDTVIGCGTKIDNLVHVGHNVHMGNRCLVMATVGIAGSVRIGNDVVIAGGVGIADHAQVGDGATISARSVVFGPSRIASGAVVGGYPARSHREFLRAQAALYRLTPLVDNLEALVQNQPVGAAPHD